MMIFTKRLLAILCLCVTRQGFSQQVDIFKIQDSTTATGREPVINTFYSTRLVNSHTVEILSPAVWISGSITALDPPNQGFYEMFGLDQASMRMGFDFGLCKNLMIGIGRFSTFKEYDWFAKWRMCTRKQDRVRLCQLILLVQWLIKRSTWTLLREM
jgi:hypothetical protein